MKKFIYNPLCGLPLLYLGVLLMVVHFAFHINSNTLLLIAFLMEIIGATLHYYKLKHPHK